MPKSRMATFTAEQLPPCSLCRNRYLSCPTSFKLEYNAYTISKDARILNTPRVGGFGHVVEPNIRAKGWPSTPAKTLIPSAAQAPCRPPCCCVPLSRCSFGSNTGRYTPTLL